MNIAEVLQTLHGVIEQVVAGVKKFPVLPGGPANDFLFPENVPGQLQSCLAPLWLGILTDIE